jgi:branched-chain amino acid transport system ATP-binding protein
MSTLETHALSKNFGALQVTQDVSLRFESGRRYAVIGPNGAGKTTLFNLLTGELRPTEGRVRLDSLDITSFSPDARARTGIGRSFQKNNLFPELSVRDSLAMAAAVGGRVAHVFWRRFAGFERLYACAEEVALQVGLAEDLSVPVRHLSYGSQRQLEVGMALACKPRVLLLDEPTSGMSPEETTAMQELIVGLPRELTVIVIEHDMDVVFGFAETVVVLDHGTVLEQGSPDDIRASSVVRELYLGELAA